MTYALTNLQMLIDRLSVLETENARLNEDDAKWEAHAYQQLRELRTLRKDRDELATEVQLLKAELSQANDSRDMYRECWEHMSKEYSKLCAKQQRSAEDKYYGIVDDRIERLVLIDEMPGRGGYTYFHTYDTEETLVVLEDGQWIMS